MSLIPGDKLTPELQRVVLAAFIYRWTSDNPHRATTYGLCSTCGVPGGEPEPTLQRADRMDCRQRHPVIALQTDAEWLAGHAFYVTRAGKLDARRRNAEPRYMVHPEGGMALRGAELAR